MQMRERRSCAPPNPGNHAVDPDNPTHYGPAQFSQSTFSGVARNHPELGISPSMSMYDATDAQYSAITSALTQDDAAALQKAGLPTTPANLYMMHNLGAPVAMRALAAGPDATLAQAGIPASYVAANPSIYGGLTTIGQVQARVAAKLAKGAAAAGAVDATTSSPALAPITVHSLGEAMGTTTPAMVDGVSPNVPQNYSTTGKPVAHDYGKVGDVANGEYESAASTGRVSDPSSLSMFGAMAGRANGFGTDLQGAMPGSMQGQTGFDGTPVSYGGPAASDASTTTTAAGTPDAATDSHLSVPKGITNFGANVALSTLGGPIGGIVAGVNGLSGLLGGPTIADGINGGLSMLGTGGAPAGDPLGGRGDNSTSPGRSGSADLPAYYGPSTSSAGSGGGASSAAAPGKGSGSGTAMPPLVITPIHQTYRVPGSRRAAMDPAVARALAAMRG